MKISDGQMILFNGDSITDCDRRRPVGVEGGLGGGYVAILANLLAARHPQRRIRVLNTGICGFRVVDLQKHWQRDVVEHNPDWLSVMIGINDVWRQFRNPSAPDQVTIEMYEAAYRDILGRSRPHLKGLILATPYFIEPDAADPMRARMDAYGKVVRRLAGEFDAVFVDTQAAFDRYLRHRPSSTLADDRVHPNQIGHTIIALAFLDAIES